MVRDQIESQQISKYSLIVIDYDMPIMNGIECAQELLLMYYRKNMEPPLIAILTAFDKDELKR